MKNRIPQRGDVISINLSPTRGREQFGKRPALVLSPKEYNITGLCIIAPITSKVKGYNFEVRIAGSEILKGVVLSDQIKSIDWLGRGYVFIEKISEKTLFETQQRVALIIGVDLDFMRMIF